MTTKISILCKFVQVNEMFDCPVAANLYYTVMEDLFVILFLYSNDLP